ncbi:MULTISPECIES: lipase family protein [unclassified Dietzia]|uniref:lipase family protein n=2 Tax=Dietzia TaxID=37914 RepID=UPI000D1FF962|nr:MULTISPECIES: lipase family protein [unclassified Dietzia]AVZ38361.1 lipase [Dietzia sp. JS16-p6b]MBB1027431.1 lipase [Dietzia sp. DQ11-38-2]QGW23380.1 putative lipase [Dietzia sp. DQ12-45-1b]
MFSRRPRRPATAALAMACALACAVAGSPALAQPRSIDDSPTVSAPDPLSAVRAAPPEERTPERYLPSPSPDPWYHSPPAVDPGTAPGTILATRPVAIPPYNVRNFGRGWQVLVQSTDSHDRPQQIVSTIIEPATPWPGPGPRPLVSFNVTIDSLGLDCMPSYVLPHKFNFELPPFLQILADRGYGLVLTDFQGPRAAYGAGRANGRAVLDGIRAARAFTPAGDPAPLFGESRVVQVGYSGGGIATGWAAQLQPVYAPELTGVLAGSSVGGVPADYSELFDTMDGTLASGLYRAAVLGLAREYPQLYSLLNDTGDVVAHQLRDACAPINTVGGLAPFPLSVLTDADPRTDPTVQEVMARNRLGRADPAHGADPREVPSGPVQVWHADAVVPMGPGPGSSRGPGDTFVPEWTAHRLVDEWCAAGADVEYTPVAGEHVTAAYTAVGPALDWVDARARGVPFTTGCR